MRVFCLPDPDVGKTMGPLAFAIMTQVTFEPVLVTARIKGSRDPAYTGDKSRSHPAFRMDALHDASLARGIHSLGAIIASRHM